MDRRRKDIYGGQDPREVPAHTLAEAAHLAQLPVSTLTHWVAPVNGEHSPPLIHLQRGPRRLLSFANLVEAFVLAAIRRRHGISFPKVRRALKYLGEEMGVARPLINARLKTDGAHLFVETMGRIVNVSTAGQTEIRSAIVGRLKRIAWDTDGIASRLFPLPRSGSAETDQPKSIVIDPRRAFGQTVIAGTGIKTIVLAERHRAGDSLEALAKDYKLGLALIEDAIRFEYRYRAAA